MSTAELRLVSGAALSLFGLVTLTTAAKAYGARHRWSGHATLALGVLLIGGSQLAFNADSPVGAWLGAVGAILAVGGAWAGRRPTPPG